MSACTYKQTTQVQSDRHIFVKILPTLYGGRKSNIRLFPYALSSFLGLLLHTIQMHNNLFLTLLCKYKYKNIYSWTCNTNTNTQSGSLQVALHQLASDDFPKIVDQKAARKGLRQERALEEQVNQPGLPKSARYTRNHTNTNTRLLHI